MWRPGFRKDAMPFRVGRFDGRTRGVRLKAGNRGLNNGILSGFGGEWRVGHQGRIRIGRKPEVVVLGGRIIAGLDGDLAFYNPATGRDWVWHWSFGIGGVVIAHWYARMNPRNWRAGKLGAVLLTFFLLLIGATVGIRARRHDRDENSAKVKFTARNLSPSKDALSAGSSEAVEAPQRPTPPMELTPEENRRASVIVDDFKMHIRGTERKNTKILYAIDLDAKNKNAMVVAGIANATTQDYAEASDYLANALSKEPSEAVRKLAQERAWSACVEFNTFPTAYRGVVVHRSPEGLLTYLEMNIENEQGISVDERTGAVTLSSPKAFSSRSGPIQGAEDRYEYLLQAGSKAVEASQ